MRLIVTADLHYDIIRSQQPARRVAEEICGLRADALLILGDVAGRDAGIVSDCLHLFDRFEGVKLFVAGNHDLWTKPGMDSLDRLDRVLPDLCRQAGFMPLDAGPVMMDHFGFVGCVGWYDFSFRPERLGIPLRFYQAKLTPGAAARLPGYEHLLEDTSDIPEAAMHLGTRWMDGEHVRLPMSDVDFCHLLLARLKAHLDQAARQSEVIVAGMHHLPFRELLPEKSSPGWAFAGAFLGSERFGEVLLSEPKVRYLFCGHSHRPLQIRCGHIECVDVGCTYMGKCYEILDVQA